MSRDGVRQRVARLTARLEYPDGTCLDIDGTDLLATAEVTMPDYPAVDAQDIAPFAILPAKARHFTLDVTLDLRGRLTLLTLPPPEPE
jgi:hypothetical protein